MVKKIAILKTVAIMSLFSSLVACSQPAANTPEPEAKIAPAQVGSESNPKSTDKPIEPKTIKITLTGDFLIHSNVWAAASTSTGFDFYPLIKPVAPIIKRADLALCHLETPLAPAGGPYSSYPLFSAPPALLPAVKKAGYDGCTTASNHTVDKGFEGVKRTIDLLDKNKLKHSGSYKNAKAYKIAYYNVKGVKVASLSFTYGTNGMPVEKPFSVNLINVKSILAQAKEAKSKADVVLLSMHWGSEYQVEPDDLQVELAQRLTKSANIDLIYGHHAHVVQPIRKVNGKWVIFGLGNFLAGQSNYAPGVNNGVIANVTIKRNAKGKIIVERPKYIHTTIGSDFVVRKTQ